MTADEWEEREIAKHKNEPRPDKCPECSGPLESSKGYVGEEVLFCPNPNCKGVHWEDSEDAIRRVI